jgi:ASC-1-like (ASCH) protein
MKDKQKLNTMIERDSIVHQLKIQVQYADLHLTNKKNWEIRKNDRDFKIGDKIHFTIVSNITRLPIYNTGYGYTREIDFIFVGGEYGLEEGYCILSIS